MTNEPENNKRKPDYYVHASVPNGRNNRVGARIGVVFRHKQGDGLTIFLDAQPIPVGGQIELVAFAPKDNA